MAEQIRTRLEQDEQKPQLTLVKKRMTVDLLDEVSFGKTTRQQVREFSCIMALVLLLISGVKLLRHSGTNVPYYYFAAAIVFLFLGYFAPKALHPIWKGWMKFANLLGMVMSTVLVSIAWFLMFVPMGILFKIIGKRVMDLSYGEPVSTYWEERDVKYNDFKLLERQY